LEAGADRRRDLQLVGLSRAYQSAPTKSRMSILIYLSEDEVARIKSLTKLDDEAQAVSRAARELLRVRQLQELKAAPGNVDFVENWQELETLERNVSSNR
jgi:hypothetical protein